MRCDSSTNSHYVLYLEYRYEKSRYLKNANDILNRYTAACSKLLVQYKAAFKQVENEEFRNVESFMKKYKVSIINS